MHPDRDEVYVEWLAAAPKGVRWDKAQEMYALYQERRKEQAAIIAGRLLGKIEQGEALFFLPGKWENVNGKWSKTDGN
jgi:hypothetical protein